MPHPVARFATGWGFSISQSQNSGCPILRAVLWREGWESIIVNAKRDERAVRAKEFMQ
jgi:hypothetical protein